MAKASKGACVLTAPVVDRLTTPGTLLHARNAYSVHSQRPPARVSGEVGRDWWLANDGRRFVEMETVTAHVVDMFLQLVLTAATLCCQNTEHLVVANTERSGSLPETLGSLRVVS